MSDVVTILKANGGILSLPRLATELFGRAFAEQAAANINKARTLVKSLERCGKVSYGRGGGASRYQGIVRLIE